MRYLFQLLPHPNVHYRASQAMLGSAELSSMLHALNIEAQVVVQTLGGAEFLCFEADTLSEEKVSRLARHSSLLMLCEEAAEGTLRPLSILRKDYLSRELAEVLKYKGKTSATFTRMMLNMACAAAGVLAAEKTPTVLDPICGRGTTLFCALEMGMNAVGLDVDCNDLQEAMRYFSRYCTMKKLKHNLKQGSETCGDVAVPSATYTLADTREHYAAGETRMLRLFHGDTALAGRLVRKARADVLVADLPYGVQHAPQAGRKPEGFRQLLKRALPAWQIALRPGGAAAISFNTLTLKRRELQQLMEEAGFIVLEDAPYGKLEHFVEQAVTRDVIIAKAE